MNNKIEQNLFSFYMRKNVKNGIRIDFDDISFGEFSQTNEDGILLYIFSLIGCTNRICLDVVFENPNGSNTANLILNNNFNGLLICSNDEKKNETDKFFKLNRTRLFPPLVCSKFVKRENINEISSKIHDKFTVENHEIDLLSLDLDGVDYWIWDALEDIVPRVVVVEYHNVLGMESVTIPYDENFNRFNIHENYLGASLPAFVKLARKKGYRLVGCNIHGYNAFFIKNDLGHEYFPEVKAEECLSKHQAKFAHEKYYEGIKDLPWIQV